MKILRCIVVYREEKKRTEAEAKGEHLIAPPGFSALALRSRYAFDQLYIAAPQNLRQTGAEPRKGVLQIDHEIESCPKEICGLCRHSSPEKLMEITAKLCATGEFYTSTFSLNANAGAALGSFAGATKSCWVNSVEALEYAVVAS